MFSSSHADRDKSLNRHTQVDGLPDAEHQQLRERRRIVGIAFFRLKLDALVIRTWLLVSLWAACRKRIEPLLEVVLVDFLERPVC